MASIAHIGYGYWGRNLARNFAELGRLAAVVDADPAAAEAAAASLNVRAASFVQVLADPDIVGVSIASPAAMHAGHVKAALQAGKHVFVEKPLALDYGAAEELCVLAESRGLCLMVGHLLQYHPAFVRLREMTEGGTFGRVLHVHSSRLSLGKLRTEENVLWSFAPHDVSMILALFGAEPVEVSARGGAFMTPGLADIASVAMRFPDSGSAEIHASWLNPFKEHRLTLIGEKAMAVFEDSEPDWNAKLRLYRHGFHRNGPVPIPVKAEAEFVQMPRAEPLKEECRHFLDCIDRGSTPRTDGREGLRVLKVLDRAERALAQNLAGQDAAGLPAGGEARA